MTDLSKYTLAELEAMKCDEAWKHYNAGKAIDAVNAEIKRRKSEPDWSAWEPKWQAFREAMGWNNPMLPMSKPCYIRALIAAHNTPLLQKAGECQSCHGLNLSCPKGCERGENGELTPLVGEDAPDEGWTYWELGMIVPRWVSQKTHEVQFFYKQDDGEEWEWVAVVDGPCWDVPRYRYRLKQTDEVRP